MSGRTLSDSSKLSLEFDYTTADPREVLYVHLWGCTKTEESIDPELINLGAQNGNAWLANAPGLQQYNLAKPDGVFSGSPGSGSDAAAILSGASGEQSFSGTFDLSSFISAPNKVQDYDFLVLAFAREISGTTAPAVSVTNIRLALDGSDTVLFAFPRDIVPLDNLQADPENDGRPNLMEFAMGGDPNANAEQGLLPQLENSGGVFQYVYRRRRDAASSGLSYTVLRSTNLEAGDWSPVGVTETVSSPVDSLHEEVSNSVLPSEKVFLRLQVQSSN